MNRILLDLSSLCWTSLYAGVDKEHGVKVHHEGKEILVNSAQYGYENAMNIVAAAMRHTGVVPSGIVIVEETGSSTSYRRGLYEGYKTKATTRPELAYTQFTELKRMIKESLRDVGAIHVVQPNIEADDIIAYLVEHLQGEITILSNDGDLAALLAPNVKMWKGGQLVEDNPFGPFPSRYIRLYKALVGDASDTYPGAKGFGDKAFLNMALAFGEEGLDAFIDLLEKEETFFRRNGKIRGEWLATLQEDVAEFPPLQKVIDNIDTVVRCWMVAKLYTDKVDTVQQPLQWTAGMVKEGHFDERLRPFSQQMRLVTSENYTRAYDFLKSKVESTPWFALDIETSVPQASKDWLEAGDRDNKLDVFGSELTGCSITFGSNGQYTWYMSVDHADTPNITSEEARRMVALIPSDKLVVVHNASFELPILYKHWGAQQQDNGWHGFLPNVIDSAIMSSYVDENKSQGLKQNSKLHLDYDQTDYDTVTEGKKYQMNELTGEHVFHYGADDTICTLALANYFRLRMEVEETWDVFMEVEQLPAYVCALAFHQGTKFSLQKMKELEREDAETYEAHERKLHQFLIRKGWEGSEFKPFTALDAPSIKEAARLILGDEFKTAVRTPDKLFTLIEALDHEDAPLLAKFMRDGNLAQINDWGKRCFKVDKVLDMDSPKAMRAFLYDLLDLPVRIVNPPTPNERREKPDLAAACTRHRRIQSGSQSEAPLTAAEHELLKQKAKTDDTAIDFALVMDCEDKQEAKAVLEAIKTMKRCATRSKMFYKPYANLLHWKDQKIHGQMGQSRTVTRRFAPNDPNLAQLPKKGEGVKFRECFLPHHRDAVIVSIDFNGQELRQGAAQSGDANMLACYIGDHKKDMHSLTAAGAMKAKWGAAKLAELRAQYGKEGDDDYTLFMRLRKCEDKVVAKMASTLRTESKSCNFLAQYGGQAAKLSETLVIPVQDAEAFLQAKQAAFPEYEAWKARVERETQQLGYVKTPMGARRHLRESLISEEWGVADKAMRQSANFKIQGASAEQTKLAMARLWSSGALLRLDMVFFAPIHDELVWSVHRDHVLESIKVVHNAMTQPYGDLDIPFLGSVSLGPNFGEQHECGDETMENPILLDTKVPAVINHIFVKETSNELN